MATVSRRGGAAGVAVPPFVREGAIRVRSLGGVARVLPDFLIIGIKKGGTTSLNRYLRQHPHVRGASRKEPRFFHAHWERGPLWYRSFFPRTSARRRHEAEHGRPFLSFEATPTYLYWPEVPGRVTSLLDEPKVIALLRDPVDRAFSDYQSLVKVGREHRSFEDVVAAELRLHETGGARARPHGGDEGAYDKLLSFGLYDEHLARWDADVDPSRMLVLGSEEFFDDEPGTVRTVTDFLGLPPSDGYDFSPRNIGGYDDRVEPATRARLQAFFAPHNARLYERLGRDLGWDQKR